MAKTIILGPYLSALFLAIVALIGLEIFQRMIYPRLPRAVTSRYERMMELYLWAYERYVVPDWCYKLWYRTGMLDAESYRAKQDQGIIKDELDPSHLQKYE